MSSLETILGDADFSLTKIDSLPNLRYVKGTFCPCDFKILPKLEILGSDAHFENTLIEEIPNLKIIKGNTYFDKSQTYLLKRLIVQGCNIQGDIFVENKKIDKEKLSKCNFEEEITK